MIPQNVKNHHSLQNKTQRKDQKNFELIFLSRNMREFFFQKFSFSIYRVLTRTKLHKTVDDTPKRQKTPFTSK